MTPNDSTCKEMAEYWTECDVNRALECVSGGSRQDDALSLWVHCLQPCRVWTSKVESRAAFACTHSRPQPRQCHHHWGRCGCLSEFKLMLIQRIYVRFTEKPFLDYVGSCSLLLWRSIIHGWCHRSGRAVFFHLHSVQSDGAQCLRGTAQCWWDRGPCQ